MNNTNCFHDKYIAEVARGLSCLEANAIRNRTHCKSCPYAMTVGKNTFCDTKTICGEAFSTLVTQFSKLKRHDQFLRWLAHVVTTDGSDAANMELICRKLAKMGYIDVGDGGVWREAEQDGRIGKTVRKV